MILSRSMFGQALQAHVEDRLRLRLAEAELARSGRRARRPEVGGGADEAMTASEMLDGDLQALEDVQPLLRLAQLVDRAPRDDVLAVVDEDLQRILEM